MLIQLNPNEHEFLANTLIDRISNSIITCPSTQEVTTITKILDNLSINNYNFNSQEVRYLQYVLQEQAEIWGSRRSTANEKSGTVGPGMNFVPQKTLILIKSITDKLGADLTIDTVTRTDVTTGRQEGSSWVMKNPVDKTIP